MSFRALSEGCEREHGLINPGEVGQSQERCSKLGGTIRVLPVSRCVNADRTSGLGFWVQKPIFSKVLCEHNTMFP